MRRVTITLVKNLREDKEYLFASLREELKKQGINLSKRKLKSLGYKIINKNYFLP